MKLDTPAAHETQLLWNVEQPLRSEPFSVEHLEEHAREIARRHEVDFQPQAGRRLDNRLEENRRHLEQAYQAIAQAVREGEPITPDAEWLLDNYYVVEEHLREIEEDLPPGFYYELPKFTQGELAGIPRVYLLALELIAHTDSELDNETLIRYVSAYQSVAALTIGELWAIPTMLRLGLVENLRRLADQAHALRKDQLRVADILEHWRCHGELLFDDTMSVESPALTLQLVERLRDAGPDFSDCLARLEQTLTKNPIALDVIARHEQQRQASNQVSIGNVISSMRLITALDWSVFFERTSLVDVELRRDPSDFYRQMDFDTRDRYRHLIEDLSKRSHVSQVQVARQVVELAEAAQQAGDTQDGRNHVGYYLVDQGRATLEAQLGYRPAARMQIIRWAKRHPGLLYFGGLIVITGLLVGLAVWYGLAHGASVGMAVLIGLLTLLPSSELAVGVMNYFVTTFVPPHILPKLEFTERLPEAFQTIVVIPALPRSVDECESLLERLETHYLSNPQPGFLFALLTDFADASEKHQPQDESLLAHMQMGIEQLNARYAGTERELFYLCHRERRWNEAQRQWMGWERKRGKLYEFNRLLRGATDTSYALCTGDRKQLLRTKYVITVDADTQIPHGAARRLVGTLAHPLNRPRLSADGHCVCEGYSILQPRIGFNLASAGRSLFSRMYANHAGIDPYATAASDVYQDLFGEGSFTGKGIYDIETFEQTLARTFPENQILSHDLIEGCHARVALASDIELIDGFPSNYEADARRQHRWVRGDWQLLPWLGRHVPTQDGWRRNPLSALSRWKIFDNMRRSLVPVALLALLVCGWLVLPGAAWVWTATTLAVLALPVLLQIGSILHHWPRRSAWQQYFNDFGNELLHRVAQAFVAIVFLPYRAYLMVDAIGRTLWRMFVSRQQMLEWETAAAVETRLGNDLWSSLRTMWFPLLLVLITVPLLRGNAWWVALPVLLLWIASPLVSWWISRPLVSRDYKLTTADRQRLRMISRKTWAYFETFVVAEENWLPPDNFQEYPESKIAHRVSPTNTGLYLASALAARDLGYVSAHELARMLERNLATLEKLPRLRGHFYNWYDTTTLACLYPRYVSTVDSGNLAACFLTVARGLEDLQQQPLFSEHACHGLQDTLTMVQEAISRLHPPGARFVSRELEHLEGTLQQIHDKIAQPPGTLVHWYEVVTSFGQDADQLDRDLHTVESQIEATPHELSEKVRQCSNHLRGLAHDLHTLLPWVPVALGGCQRELPTSAGAAPRLNGAEAEAPLQEAWQALWTELRACQSLSAISQQLHTLHRPLTHFERLIRQTSLAPERKAELQSWFQEFTGALERGARNAEKLLDRYAHLASRFETLTMEMDFRFLFNPQRRLFSVGFNAEEGRLDYSHYDLLASEARLASFLAIAKGDADARHWFQLGRTMTRTAQSRALLSWGGTMFEYLMPTLFIHLYPDSLMQQTCHAAVERQREYGQQHRVPWGISESAFGALNTSADYHYQSFGVPGLGLKRGLAQDLVVSPYSTALACMLDPQAALANFEHLTAEGAESTWGYYDAIDYTKERIPPGKRHVLVRCYMAHHHGMTLLALVNCLHNGVMQRRFHEHPLAKAAELLLQERIPPAGMEIQPHADEVAAVHVVREVVSPVSRRITSPDTLTPLTHLISNGQYSIMVTNAGSGYSRCGEIDVTRWRSDTTRDRWGTFVYLRNLDNGEVWSAGYQPTLVRPSSYEVVYSIDKAEFRRRDGELETHMEVTVSPERNAEVRLVKITNHGNHPAEVELTSFAEVVLTSAAADVAHPAFHKLFIQTEYLPARKALIAKRRPRDSQQDPTWAVHVLAGSEQCIGEVEFDTDRQMFVGRGRTPTNPRALEPGEKLTGSSGAVLDPIFSLRTRLRIAPSESASVSFITAIAENHEDALNLADQFHDSRVVHRTFELAWAHSQVELRHLQLSPANAHLYQRLASSLLYPHGSRRAPSEVLLQNRLGQSSLWPYGISGDHPLVLVRVSHSDQLMLVRELLLAHQYWQTSGLKSDLVVLNEHPGTYLDALQEQLDQLVRETLRDDSSGRQSVFVLRRTHVSDEDTVLLETVASISLHSEEGGLARQIEALLKPQPLPEPLSVPVRPLALPAASPASRALPGSVLAPRVVPSSDTLRLSNRYGGFSAEGREYRIELRSNDSTPAPWSNVIANSNFGCLITESGGGYTWARNSRENKLTGWSNDPITDPPSEALYVRDDQSGELWSVAPHPLRTGGMYRIAHGAGYSRFEHQANELEQELLVSIAPADAVKFIVLKLRNDSQRARQLSITQGVEWVLGVAREHTQQFVNTQIHANSGALLATNTYHPEYPHQVAFLHVLADNRTVTGDRGEFFGRNSDWHFPAAMTRTQLSDNTGAGLDPFGAVQTKLRLAPGEEQEIIFLLGQGENAEEVDVLLERYRTAEAVHAAITETKEFWHHTLSTIHVHTPSEALDVMVNRWLIYQVLSCRVWGRSAFYQSGGAYGYRDQLQDVMALLYSRPDLTREHLLRAASRQFEEGDVQHWWHPPTGRGIRTKFSDDYLWLVFVTCHYLETTGDESVLEEMASFLRSPHLEPHEEERYELPEVTRTTASLYEHCLRSIDHGLRFGPHGLPLIGCGDWNDGMNKVGVLGQGESVWVAWFLLTILRRFIPIVERRGDQERAEHYRQHAQELARNIQDHAWDGQWYRRAYFDDGTPLGSQENSECQIDSLPQSWAVIAGSDPQRARQAMQSALERLVRREARLIQLFDPPFDKSPLDPGYIKGYLPGIRENGGQYTHAAFWLIQALTIQGEGDRAFELFDLINPVRHSSHDGDADRYKVEPYVIAADVYAVSPHTGRGGWTWYTGSASWMYRTAVESILGLRVRGNSLSLEPCIPADWPGFSLVYRHGSTLYHITVENPDRVQTGVRTVTLNGQKLPDHQITLVDDGQQYDVQITLG